MQITTERRGKVEISIPTVVIIRLHGMLDATNYQEFLAAFDAELETGTTNFVVALPHLEYIDSSGLGALIKALKKARLAGGDVKLAEIAREVRKVFGLTHLDKIFDVFPNEASALAAFGALGV